MNLSSDWIFALLLSSVTAVPLAIALFCLTRRAGRNCTALLPFAAIPAFAAAFLTPVDLSVSVPWFFMGGRMGLDATGRVFLLLTAFVWLLAAFKATGRNEKDAHYDQYFAAFFCLAMTGNLGLILALEVLGFYLFFALMSLSVYVLIINDKSEMSRSAGRIYLVFVIIGEMAMFAALALLAAGSNSLDISAMTGHKPHPAAVILLFLAFGIKTGVFPLHGWMPLSYKQAPIPAATALAGGMVNAGLLGWLRFLPLGGHALPDAGLFFIAAGVFSAFYGVICGVGQQEKGAVLAYSSMSQIGLMTTVLGLGLMSPAAGLAATGVLVVFAVHHALAKTTLFLFLDGGKVLPGPAWLTLMGVILPSLALAGFPLTSGAVAKTVLHDFFHTVGPLWEKRAAIFLPLSSAGTAILMLHFTLLFAVTRKRKPGLSPGARYAPVSALFASLLCLYLWPAAQEAAGKTFAAAKIWSAFWPASLGIIAYTAILGFTPENRFFVLPAGDFYHPLVSAAGMGTWKRPEREKRERKSGKPWRDTVYSKLRKSEKVLGRWSVAGLLFLVLCFVTFILFGIELS